MRVSSSDCNIAFDIMTYIILLYSSITVLLNQYPFPKIFVYLVANYCRKRFFCHFYAWLLVKTNHMVIKNLCFVVLTLD
jgi:hypothetical protein